MDIQKETEAVTNGKLDQQIIRDLVINTKEHAPDKQLEGDKDSMELFIKEAFENIKAPVIFGFINYSGVSDPSNP